MQRLSPLGLSLTADEQHDVLEHCPGFQGQFCYFLPIHRNREIEHQIPDPVSILLFFWIQVNSFNERSHKFFLLDFRGSTVYFIDGQQMMFSFMLADGDQPLRLCKHCQKVFLGSRSNAAFCSPRCKNQQEPVDRYYLLHVVWFQ